MLQMNGKYWYQKRSMAGMLAKTLRTCIFTVLSLLPVMVVAQSNHGFRIDGIAKGMRDSTLLYLEFHREGEDVKDSAFVIGEKFRFEGAALSPAEYTLVRTKDLGDYKFFWTENADMTFTGEKGKFRTAVVTGSRTQQEDDELEQMVSRASDPHQIEPHAEFIKKHPNSMVSVHSLNTYASTWGKEKTASLYEKLSADMKNSRYGKEIATFLSLNANLKVGDKVVDFAEPDASNKIVHLSDFQGKVVLLEFWGSWCGPCRKSNPELVKIYHEFKAKGFDVLGVASETNRQAWLNAIKHDQLSWTNVSEIKGSRNSAAMIYGISYYPTNFLIDKTGVIVAKDIYGNELRRKLRAILKTN
jgi:peroxiredoxin